MFTRSDINRPFIELFDRTRLAFICKIRDAEGNVIFRKASNPADVEYDVKEYAAKYPEYLYEAFKTFSRTHGDEFQQKVGRPMEYRDLHPALVPTDKQLRSVFIDDITEPDTIKAHFAVETSPGSFQVHYRLSRPADDAEAAAVLRMLHDWYGGDIGALKPRQMRRLATDASKIQIFTDDEILDVDYAVHHYPKPERVIDIDDHGKIEDVPDEIVKIFAQEWNERRRRTVEHDKPYGDKSVADHHVARLVLSHGYSQATAREMIREIRGEEDLLQKKGPGHIEKYLTITVQGAAQILQQRYDEELKSKQARTVRQRTL